MFSTPLYLFHPGRQGEIRRSRRSGVAARYRILFCARPILAILSMSKRIAMKLLRIILVWRLGISFVQAWDYEGHRVINQLALASLPTNFPAFVQEPPAAERIAFLAGEPDRWRNMQDLPLRHCNGPDHYIDLEELADYDLKPEDLPVFRYDFVASLALYRQAHPAKFPPGIFGKNEDHTREVVGLMPWSIAEQYARLKSAFSYLRTFQESGGTPEEIANAQADILVYMALLGHMVGDAGQPLHTTLHHHGWVGVNPRGYSTNSRIHSWIDGGYLQKVGGVDLPSLKARLRPAQLVALDGREARQNEIFKVAVQFIVEQNRQVEPLYQLDKAGKLSGNGTVGLEGKAFLEGQLRRSGQLLGDLWYTAWEKAPADTFLRGQLARRQRQAKE